MQTNTPRAAIAASILALAAAATAPAQTSPAQPDAAQTNPAETRPADDQFRWLVLDEPVTPITEIEVVGDGPIPMILLPGLHVDARAFQPFMQRNAHRYTMYAVTYPGMNATAPPPIGADQPPSSGAWFANVRAAVIQLIEERNLEKPVLLGHSIGGRMAMQLGLTHPDRFRQIINLDTLPVLPLPLTIDEGETHHEARADYIDNRVAPAMEAQQEVTWEMSIELGFRDQVLDAARARELTRIALASSKDAQARYFLESAAIDDSAEVMNTDAPLLVIAAIPPARTGTGTPEQFVSHWDQFVRLAGPNPNIQVELVDGAFHYVHDDQPEIVDQIIADALDADDSPINPD